MTDSLFGITWAAPERLPWFILVLVIVVCLLWRIKLVRGLIDWLVHEDHRQELLPGFAWGRFYIKIFCFAFAAILIGLALLRPQWDKRDELHTQKGRDLVVALDISRSMLAQDYEPNRLAYAKNKIKKLVNMLDAERVALLVFSGAAVVQCPLTTDKGAFFMFLDALSVETISSGTTSYSAALNKIADVFTNFQAQHVKLVTLFTDGEDFSNDTASLRQKIADSGIHVTTIGIATPEGAPIPVYEDSPQGAVFKGFQKDDKGAVVISRLNEMLMQQLATVTNGLYVRAVPDDSDLLTIKKWIQSFEKSSYQDRNLERLQDKYYYYAAAAWILLFIEWIL